MKVNDLYPDFISGNGIFADLQDVNVPWKDKGINTYLDLQYHGNHSGDKTVSPLAEKIYLSGTWSEIRRKLLSRTAFTMFGEKWAKEWATLSAQYNPIENYSMIETMTDDETVIDYGHTVTRTDNLSHAKTGTDTNTPNTTETETPNTTETETPNTTTTDETSVYGFNSSTASPAEGNSRTETGTNTRTTTGTNTVQYNNTETDTGTQENAESGSDTHTRNYTLERSGNIGVTTSQQMLQSERDLWMWDYFTEVVFPDIDRVLTISIY